MAICRLDETPFVIELASGNDALVGGECQGFGTCSSDGLHRPPHHGVRNTRSPLDLRDAHVNDLDRFLTSESAEKEYGHGLSFAHSDRPKPRIDRPDRAVSWKHIGHRTEAYKLRAIKTLRVRTKGSPGK